MDAQVSAFLDFALDAAWQAGRITLSYFQNGVTAERKGDDSPVTIADKNAEKRLRELIGQYWPDHGIIGEEFGDQKGAGQYTWTVDPIDGTKSFVHGVPFYSNLIALTDEKGPLVGVANFPALNETVYATRGGGCYWNGRRCRVSDVKDMKDAVALTSDIDYSKFKEKARAWQEIVSQTYFQRTWGDSYGYALVATGRAEIMVDPWMAIWDCGPLQVILEEAGGTFTDWKGTPTIYNGESFATNGHLYDEVFKIIKG
ncbi:MAG: inositol monophosphatase family protein [Chloroflexi bacterium]|nr:inositol monophosphatase family protein [Chloroflexota bacterium]MCC6892155.1 inositol monophosphatase family protein [Anaerolineae bacterium]